MPDSWHAQVRELAEQAGVSINQYITLVLAEKISALTTENYLAVRAQRGNKVKFRDAMSKVAKVEPREAKDRL